MLQKQLNIINKKDILFYTDIVARLVSLGTRQGKKLQRAATYLCKLLEKNKISYCIENYDVEMPKWGKSILKIDGKSVPSLPTGLTSGKITSNSAMASSLVSSRLFLDTPHINFNPQCAALSRANFSFAPSLAVVRDIIQKICKAKKVTGIVRVKKVTQKMPQILVGNRKNPKTIVFSHFDSIGKGAIDNASGTALAVFSIIKNPEILQEALFVFDGNEEISYDYPVYWGRGYRNFEKRYATQITNAQKLIVVDCVGYGPTLTLCEGKIISLAFPISSIEGNKNKITLLCSNFEKLMQVYHSDLDTEQLLRPKYIQNAYRTLCTCLFS